MGLALLMPRILLTFNPGSASIKLGLYALEAAQPRRIGRGMIDLHQHPLRLHLTQGAQDIAVPLQAPANDDMAPLLEETFNWLARHYGTEAIAAIGHRVVHGGDRFDGPVCIDDTALAAIAELVPLAPLHQPQSLRLIRALRRLLPDLPQIACFDTAFHHRQADLVRRFALPRSLHDAGIKRYGFHGLSYNSIANQLAADFPALHAGRVIVAHLGSGASLCALHQGRSIETSMGFSTLDGIPMATRPGTLDAGVLLHLLQRGGHTPDSLEDLLYHRSGLLGLSGISADSRLLLESPAPEARQALEHFSFRTAREILALTAGLGGLDGIVFTAGIGEHQPAIRQAICKYIRWLGLQLDPEANAANAQTISTQTSRIHALVIPTDEEQIIAEETARLLGRQAASG